MLLTSLEKIKIGNILYAIVQTPKRTIIDTLSGTVRKLASFLSILKQEIVVLASVTLTK